MSFSKLPAELQIEIFSYLENTDLKAVRSVSNSCRDNASPHLFRSIIACARYQAMGAFQNVALHPVYQKYVKEIVFDATAYDEGMAKNERLYQSPPSSGEVSWVRRSRWKRYQTLYREQEEIKGGVLLQTVARALEWMPHVESIAYCPDQLHVPVEKNLMKDILGRGTSYPNLDVPSRTNSYGSVRIENAFHNLIGAICIANYSKIRRFRVRQTQCAPSARWLALREFNFAEPEHLESGRYFFRNLQTVELGLDFRFAAGRRECLANLRTLLSEARDLLHLRLYAEPRHNLSNISSWLSDPEIQSPFECIGLEIEWPKIQTLDIGRIVATENELRGLVQRGKGTLTSINFTNCIMTTGKWSNLVDEVVYGTKIRNFVLDRVHEQYVAEVVDYEALSSEKQEQWTYEGQVKENEQGARYFWERFGKSVYAWRDLRSEEADSSVVE